MRRYGVDIFFRAGRPKGRGPRAPGPGPPSPGPKPWAPGPKPWAPDPGPGKLRGGGRRQRQGIKRTPAEVSRQRPPPQKNHHHHLIKGWGLQRARLLPSPKHRSSIAFSSFFLSFASASVCVCVATARSNWMSSRAFGAVGGSAAPPPGGPPGPPELPATAGESNPTTGSRVRVFYPKALPPRAAPGTRPSLPLSPFL